MKKISVSGGLVTSQRKYHGEVMDTVSNTGTSHSGSKDINANSDRDHFSLTETYQSFFPYGSSDSGAINFSASTPKNRKKKLNFSENIDTILFHTTFTEDNDFLNTPVLCKVKIIEAATLQNVQIIENPKTTTNNTLETIEDSQVISRRDANNYKIFIKAPLNQKNADVLTKEVLDSLKIIEQTHRSQIPVLLTESNIQNPSRQTSDLDRTVDEKFVVNLFESRPSKRWKRKRFFSKKNNELVTSKFNNNNVSCSGIQVYETTLEKHHNSEEYQHILRLKNQRDVECVRMLEVSNALKSLKSNPRRSWDTELLTEKILLESVEREKLLINAIREFSYSQIKSKSYTASLELSNFEFKLTVGNKKRKNKQFSEFFILTVAYETKLFVSEIKQPDEENLLRFFEEIVFDDVKEDFRIQFTLFLNTIKIKRSMIQGNFFCQCCHASKILDETLNTLEYEGKEILKPSFKPFAELTLTRLDLDNTTFSFKNVNSTNTQPNSTRLENTNNASFNFELRYLFINVNLSGFLTLGQKKKHSGTILWERKWCVLNGTELAIYNYPSEQDFGVQPQIHIDLKYCFGPMVHTLTNSPRKLTFVIKTGRQSLPNTTQSPKVQTKPHFLLEKFYFSADSQNEFIKWTNEIKSVLDCLRTWNKLFFYNEYCAYYMKCLQ